MSSDFFFIGLIILALGLTYFSLKVQLILFRVAPTLCWIGLGVYLLLSTDPLLKISEPWNQILGFVFLVMAIGTMILQIRSDSQHERTSKGGLGVPGAETETWTEWGPKKRRGKTKPTSAQRQAEYRMQVRGAVERGVARRK